MQWEAVIEFPKMKVAIATREARVVAISYLPLGVASKDPENELAERAARQIVCGMRFAPSRAARP